MSFCDVSATVSCTQVYSSRFGTCPGVPVAVFGAIWFAFATLLVAGGLDGVRPAVRESVPGYLFAGSTLALAVVLYLGYASFVCPEAGLRAVPDHVCRRDRALPVSGAATSIPMLSLPRRVAQDLKVLVASPLALVLAVLFVGGAATDAGILPARGRLASWPGSGGRCRRDAGAAVAAERAVRTVVRRAPRVPLVVPTEGAKVLIVKFNDYQCPACAPVVTWTTSRCSRSTQASQPGRRPPRDEGLSAQVRVQLERAHDAPRRGVRGGRRRPAGAARTSGRAARGVAVHATSRR